MSRIDKMLITAKWTAALPNTKQWCLIKGLSDHCTIMLALSNHNWGPRPFKFMDCWLRSPNFLKNIRQWWDGYRVQPNGLAIVKKLKLLKNSIKIWNQEVYGDLDSAITQLEAEIDKTDEQLDHSIPTDPQAQAYLKRHRGFLWRQLWKKEK